MIWVVIPRRLALLVLALAPVVAFAQPQNQPAAQRPCGAVGIAMAYERVVEAENPEQARADLDAVDAWYGRCEARLLDPDREFIKALQASATQSLNWPRTLEDAVDRILRDSDAKQKALVASKKRKDLIEFHFSWGMGIRNGLGLWGGNRALLLSACGGSPCHPDDASMKIIEAVWERLQQPPNDSKSVGSGSVDANPARSN